jgi:RNA exonuclease 4
VRADSPTGSTSSDSGSSSSASDSSMNDTGTCRSRQVKARSEPEGQRYVALDCEMVGFGENGKYSALARVIIVNWQGDVLMDEYIKQEHAVTDYRTFVSGITKEILDNAVMDLAACQKQVSELLKGKILVGHGLKNDLKVLGISHTWHMIRDTAKYEPYMKVRFQDGVLWPRGLKDLCKEKLNRDVQVYGRPHCPKEDALSAMDLYRLVWRQWEQSMEYKINKTKAIQQKQQVQLNPSN